MPFRPRIAQALSSLFGGPEVRDRAERLHFPDAGHGYDRFGLHPDFVALGPNHVAVGMNNRVWYYQCGGGGGGDQRALVSEREYVGTVEKVQLGDMFAAVLCEGKVHLRLIERKSNAFPPR